MLSQGPERRGWGGMTANAVVFLLSIDSCYLSETGAEKTVSYGTSLVVLPILALA